MIDDDSLPPSTVLGVLVVVCLGSLAIIIINMIFMSPLFFELSLLLFLKKAKDSRSRPHPKGLFIIIIISFWVSLL
eukprot:m.39615 g.39615  ORF g.39615 m.39615 type:complete len:76 (-) comp6877_c0_seq1:509-736(-)